MFNFFLISISIVFLLSGCLNKNILQNVKNDFSQQKNVIVYNKSLKNKSNKIPLNGMIIVQKNETIYSIANKYKIIPNEIINDNNLIEPFKLRIKQILFLRNKNVHVIKKNDTLVSLSIQFAVDQLDIIGLNKLNKPFNLKIGSKILIPAKKHYTIIDQILEKKIYKKDRKYTKNVSSNSKLINDAPIFIWPLQGKLIKKFGKFGRGQYYDGIDINSKKNIAIIAAYSGKIAFVGSEIPKFGNLILIKHNKNWLTAYSNIGKFNVNEGDNVV